MTRLVLSTPLQRARGAIGRRLNPGDQLVFEYAEVDERSVHMVGVRQPLQVTWLVDGAAERVATLRPWLGLASARADRVIEEVVGR